MTYESPVLFSCTVLGRLFETQSLSQDARGRGLLRECSLEKESWDSKMTDRGEKLRKGEL